MCDTVDETGGRAVYMGNLVSRGEALSTKRSFDYPIFYAPQSTE